MNQHIFCGQVKLKLLIRILTTAQHGKGNDETAAERHKPGKGGGANRVESARERVKAELAQKKEIIPIYGLTNQA